MGALKWMKEIDFYRKVPKDLTTSTASGAVFSLMGALMLVTLFVLEFNSYMSWTTETRIVLMDSDRPTIQVNLNISLPALACDFAHVYVTDVYGGNRVNMSKAVRKYRTVDQGKRNVGEVHEEIAHKPGRIEEFPEGHPAHETTEGSTDLNDDTFEEVREGV